MAKDKDIIASRIAGICKARPVVCPEPPPDPSQFDERAERKPVFRLASIYTGKNSFVRCVVNDINDNGARLTLQTTQVLPEIVIVKFDQNGVRKRARVVWQEGDTAGISFSADQTQIDAICTPGAPVKAVR